MGVRIASSANNTIVNAAPANGVETIILTTGALGLAQDNAQVLISWYVNLSTGVGATGISVRLRRGATTAATLVNLPQNLAEPASTELFLSGSYSDLPGTAAGLQYSISLLVTGGAAALTVQDGSIAAIVL